MHRPLKTVMYFTYTLKALPWDLAILAMIAGGIFLCVYAFKRRRKRQYLFLSFLGALIALVTIYGSFIEPRIITITRTNIELPTVEDFTIVAVSDLHVGPYKGKRFVARIVERINSLKPDLVLLLGDYVYHAGDPRDDLTPLSSIQSRYGVYAVMGNHEYGCFRGNIRRDDHGMFDASSRVFRSLERSNVTVLRNESVEVPVEGGGPLFLAGIDDACSGHDDLGKALPATTKKSSVILLAHDPSVILDNRVTYPHLILSGHTHAGQIRLPFIGHLFPLPTQLGRTYEQGLFEIDNNTTLAITRGVGESGPRARLLAVPEILVIKSSSF